MITVHHLNNSRSQRVLWLLEELGLPYSIKHYLRNNQTGLAPPELKAIHPLGKSPVIEDEGQVVAESGSNHGSDWDYDARVPLLWLGPGVRPGSYGTEVSPADVAPTIFALLGLKDPGTSGRILREMLADDAAVEPAGR